jgi:hypothetical protein
VNDLGATRKKLQMLTGRIQKEHSMKWQPRAAMFGIVCLTLSATNYLGELGPQTSVDSRKTQH